MLRNKLNPLDPSGSFVINLSQPPSPEWSPSEVAVYTGRQVYTSPYPSTKMNYPALSVSLPEPTVDRVPQTSFPVNKRQSKCGAVIAPGLVPAVKGVIYGSHIYISLIALNTTAVSLDSSAVALPPVLIDYAVSLRVGQTSITLTLKNQDHTLTIPVTLVTEA